MKEILFTIAPSLLFSVVDLSAQGEPQFKDIEMVNLGDGRLYAHGKDEAKAPINGKNRIITGYTTEYINAEFKDGYAVGKWEYYQQNKLRSTQPFVDGWAEGDSVEYQPDGETIRLVTPFSKGVVDGTMTTYYPDGKTVESAIPFSKGVVVGLIARYYPNGKIESEKGMNNNVEDGPDRRYNDDGTMTAETIYKNGKPDGKSFANIASNTGDYLRTSFYKDGLLDGEYSEVFTNGTIKVKGSYKNGKKDGEWISNRKDGRKQPTEIYDNGELAKKITYYTNDQIDTEKEMKNGKEHGLTKQYTVDGTLKAEKNFVNGRQVGNQMILISSTVGDYYEYTTFDDEGRKSGQYSQVYVKGDETKLTGLYQKGQKHGKWIYYTKGKPSYVENYDNGKLLNSESL